MVGPFIDTHIICTMTALVILSAGVSATGDGVVMTANAFESAMPGIGKLVLAVIFSLFAISTMISYSYYSLKCSRYLFGKQFGNHFIYVYLLLIPIAAVWSQNTIINIIDTAFAMMAIPTLISSLLLSPKVIAASKEYFNKI
jgi:alanine or glycine:cation symporter, AGCS family